MSRKKIILSSSKHACLLVSFGSLFKILRTGEIVLVENLLAKG
jgi:hypothetical protein